MSPPSCCTARRPANAASAASPAASSALRTSANCCGHSVRPERAAESASSGVPMDSMTRSNSGGCRCRATKISACSESSKGGSTATMSSITASLIAGPLFQILVQPRRLEQLGAVDRGEHHVEGDAFMVHRKWHVDAGMSERPEPAIELGLAGDALAIDRQDDVASLELGAGRGAVVGDADDDDLVVDLGRIEPEPRSRRPVDATEFAQIIEHRLEQVDRHDHVDMLGLAVALAFELQRADADQFA